MEQFPEKNGKNKPYAKIACTDLKGINHLIKHEIKTLKTIRSEKLHITFNTNLLKYKKPKQPADNYLERKKNYEIKTYIAVKINLENRKLIN